MIKKKKNVLQQFPNFFKPWTPPYASENSPVRACIKRKLTYTVLLVFYTVWTCLRWLFIDPRFGTDGSLPRPQ